MRIRSILIVAFLCATMIPSTLSGWRAYQMGIENEFAEVSDRHLLLARNLGNALERYYIDLVATTESISSSMVKSDNSLSFDEIFVGLNIEQILLVQRKSGNIVSKIEKIPSDMVVLPPSLLQKLTSTASAEKTQFSEVMASPNGNNVLYAFRNFGDNLAVSRISTKFFVELGKSISFGQKGHAAIVDHAGNVLAHPLPSWIASRKNIVKVSAVKRMLNGETGIEQFYSPALKGDMIAGLTAVPGAGWGVMIPQPVSELYAKVYENNKSAMLAIGVGFLVSIALVLLLLNLFAKPLEQVIAALRKNSEANQVQKISFRSSLLQVAELNAFQDSYNSMVSTVEVSKQRFAAIAKANSDWFWEMDGELRFSYFSDTFEEVTGVAPSMLLGKTRGETGVPSVEQEVLDQHLADMQDGKPFRDFVHSRTARDGSLLWLSINGNPVYDEQGKFQGYVGSGRDVTKMINQQNELKNANAQAQAANKSKSEFLANMSHEIRTPMNGVMGMAEMLAQSNLDARQQQFTDIILSSSSALLTIINDILDFSKIDSGKLELDPVPFNLNSAINDVAVLLSDEVLKKNLDLSVKIQPDLPQSVIGDVGRFRQILTNLVGNAVKFTEEGRVAVDVTGDIRGGKVGLKIEVSDTGVGIPEDQLQNVFEKFSQVDASFTRRHEGTGLGLAITRRLVSLMGGEIGNSSILGKGSRFWITFELPINVTEEKANDGMQKLADIDSRSKDEISALDAKQSDSSGSNVLTLDQASNVHVLVAEDNLVNQMVFEQILQQKGYNYKIVENGQLAVEEALFSKPAIILMDISMPVLNGQDATRNIRNLTENGTHCDGYRPIIIGVTAHALKGDKELCIDAGMDDYLSKPVSPNALISKIENWIPKLDSVSNSG